MPLDLGTKLSIVDISLTVIGFSITVWAAAKARSAADAAKEAASTATQSLIRVDIIAEIATVLHLLEELKRLQRAKAMEVLPDRYSGLRSRLVAIRESTVLAGELDQTAIQDVIARLASLEKLAVQNPQAFDNPKQLANSNGSLSTCTDAMLGVKERIRLIGGTTT
jgi:hypothetical protein